MSIKNNICLPVYRDFNSFGIVNDRKLGELVDRYVAGLAIKTQDADNEAQNLSGGNQQKVVLAKWLASEPKVLILDEPTRGIVIGSKSEIHRLIREMREGGLGVLVISSEIPELLSLSDRIIIMRDGLMEGELDRRGDELTEEAIIRLATIGDDENGYAV
jgi:ABC-type sugar transport system ATPase subunit